MMILAAVLVGVAGEARGQSDPLFRIDPNTRLGALAEAPRWGVWLVRCNIRSRQWLERLHGGVAVAIAEQVEVEGMTGDTRQTAILLHWGAAGMARYLGERSPRNIQPECREMQGQEYGELDRIANRLSSR